MNQQMVGILEQYVGELAQAEKERTPIAALTERFSSLTVEEAYRIQLLGIQEKTKAGQRIVGKKIGLTSYAMQQLLGVDQPDYGHLLDSMAVENGSVITPNRILQAKVEGEIAFILKKDLQGTNVTLLDVLQATDYVLPAIEIVDSRITDWKIKLPDTIADNASSGLYVLGGKPVRIEDIDLELAGMVLYRNGQMINTGVGAAALGHPATCVAWLANKLSEFGIGLKAGEVILSGALSAAVPVQPGDHFSVRIAHLGEVNVSFAMDNA